MSAVQFFGKESVLTAYKARGFDVWGLFQGKNLITSGEDAEGLEQFLTMLEPGGSSAQYTLKVFRDLDDPDDVTDKTEANGSFSFKLSQPLGSLGRTNEVIINRLEAIEKRLEDSMKVEDEAEADDENDIGFIMMQYLKDPQKLALGLQAIKGFISSAMAPQTLANVPAAVGSVSDPNEKLERLSVALDKLESKDPNIVEHLEKLAKIAEEKPGTFTMLLNMLENGL